MSKRLTVLMAQINPTVGALASNQDKIMEIIKTNQDSHDLILFPELALTGYPPEDLLHRPEFQEQVDLHLKKIQSMVENCYVVVGHPSFSGRCYNSFSIFYKGRCIRQYHKQNLPNYEIFDEARYFSPGHLDPCLLEINGTLLGLCICEDLWKQGPVENLIAHGAKVILSINASPFDTQKYEKRVQLLQSFTRKGVSLIYVNQVGGQDELLFDGQSLAINKEGQICARAKAFQEDLCTVTLENNNLTGPITPLLAPEALLYEALLLGLRDYVNKNNFPGVLLGLSGGIDSALTLALAVDALGAKRVQAIMMPSRYTASISFEDALQQLEALNVCSHNLSIEPTFETILNTLSPAFENKAPDSTEENIQARIRGLFLMALSNKNGYMVLTTSNKSETAVGYSTLYGDMAGGFAPLKDVLKTQVYALANYRNSLAPVIPKRVIERAPSAELRENQTDQETLPPYEVLDGILVAYMEKNLSIENILQQGYKASEVQQIIHLMTKNEYKRRQSAPGIKVSPIAFGKDWRYPITNHFRS